MQVALVKLETRVEWGVSLWCVIGTIRGELGSKTLHSFFYTDTIDHARDIARLKYPNATITEEG